MGCFYYLLKRRELFFDCFVIILVVGLLAFLGSCGSNNEDELPSLQNDDVCTAMDDIDLMKWCYDHYDVNGDGKVSKTEAAAVRDFKASEGN